MDEQQCSWVDGVFLLALYAEHAGENGLFLKVALVNGKKSHLALLSNSLIKESYMSLP
jgi:hypothetical protein